MVSQKLPVSCRISYSDHVNNFRNEFPDPETIGKYTLTMLNCWCLNLCFMPFSGEIFNPENDWLTQNRYLQSKNEFGYESMSKYYQNSCRNNFTSHYSCDIISLLVQQLVIFVYQCHYIYYYWCETSKPEKVWVPPKRSLRTILCVFVKNRYQNNWRNEYISPQNIGIGT